MRLSDQARRSKEAIALRAAALDFWSYAPAPLDTNDREGLRRWGRLATAAVRFAEARAAIAAAKGTR